ncbi:kynureninase [Luteibacter sp. PPL201]|uniref:Kynureninase n=1 Tax=Luteibacter sahnii TaxID=3021977 RepID=A0ABT6BB98_9GAMM
MTDFECSHTWAEAQDAADPLRAFRDEFHIPPHDGRDALYFCGNSLGLQPKGVAAALQAELDDWSNLAVEAHFRGRSPWMHYHEYVRDTMAEVVGAMPHEVVAMNSLGVNLHLMMVSFYRPTAERPAILMEAGAFPTDRYALESQVRFHGFDPARDLIELHPDGPGGTLSMQAIEQAIAEHGHRVALILLPGIQYRTGQVFDLARIVSLGHAAGCAVGFDLAHAVGNLPLTLHDDGPDFAVWCTYKYLNAGPGAVAGAFVHERHARADVPRFAGWWGHDKTTRFQMGPTFVPTPGADGWQLSNPPIMALAPLRASLDVFHRAGMTALSSKSRRLTAYLDWLIRSRLDDVLDIVTPNDPAQRAAQLSIRVRAGRDAGRALFEHLERHGVIGDWREPDVIRLSPTPLYNRYADCFGAVEIIEAWRRSVTA